jgi:hypothetical protein
MRNNTGQHIQRVQFNAKGEPTGREIFLSELKQRIREVKPGPDGNIYAITDETFLAASPEDRTRPVIPSAGRLTTIMRGAYTTASTHYRRSTVALGPWRTRSLRWIETNGRIRTPSFPAGTHRRIPDPYLKALPPESDMGYGISSATLKRAVTRGVPDVGNAGSPRPLARMTDQGLHRQRGRQAGLTLTDERRIYYRLTPLGLKVATSGGGSVWPPSLRAARLGGLLSEVRCHERAALAGTVGSRWLRRSCSSTLRTSATRGENAGPYNTYRERSQRWRCVPVVCTSLMRVVEYVPSGIR